MLACSGDVEAHRARVWLSMLIALSILPTWPSIITRLVGPSSSPSALTVTWRKIKSVSGSQRLAGRAMSLQAGMIALFCKCILRMCCLEKRLERNGQLMKCGGA
jgi:hypothetical protein